MCVTKQKVYIAGRVTGLYRWYVVLVFSVYAKKLRKQGYEVVNPMEIVPATASWGEAMTICLDALRDCDKLFIMPNWPDSKGATIEIQKAYGLDIPVVNVSLICFGLLGIKMHKL